MRQLMRGDIRAIARWAGPVVALCAIVVGVAPGAVAAAGTVDRDAVRAAISEVVDAVSPAFVWHAVDETGEWGAAAGVAALKSSLPASRDAAFRIASITKMFTAVGVLQLVADGRIDLDAHIARYLPGLLARGDVITVRELLQHRSGLGDPDIGNGHGNTWYPGLEGTCNKSFDATALIREADDQLFEPGTDFSYSNAGYMVLGLLIEAVTGRPYEQVLTDRIVRPLGLADTSFQEGVPQWPDEYVHGYGNFLPGAIEHRNYTDESACRTSFFGAAGSGISTPRDLVTFMCALTSGRLLPEPIYRQMITTLPTNLGPGVEYGLGIIRRTYCGVVQLGHAGLLTGYQSYLWSAADGSRVFADVTTLVPGTAAIALAVHDVHVAETCPT